MTQATLTIGGRRYEVPCRDGEQARLAALGAIVDEKARAAGDAVGAVNEVRQLLFAALLLADELAEARGHGARPEAAVAPAVDALAARLEQIAARLEKH